jgi:tubulin polyglutamylase TTLL6/13
VEQQIDDIIIKTIISAQNQMLNIYNQCVDKNIEDSLCFELLGFDIMLDEFLKPWLIEINHAPSFAVETKFDQDLKEELISDTFAIINMTPL